MFDLIINAQVINQAEIDRIGANISNTQTKQNNSTKN